MDLGRVSKTKVPITATYPTGNCSYGLNKAINMVLHMHSIRIVYLYVFKSFRITDKTSTFFTKVEKVDKNGRNGTCTFLQSMQNIL